MAQLLFTDMHHKQISELVYQKVLGQMFLSIVVGRRLINCVRRRLAAEAGETGFCFYSKKQDFCDMNHCFGCGEKLRTVHLDNLKVSLF